MEREGRGGGIRGILRGLDRLIVLWVANLARDKIDIK
jgi:hypothetical protein